MVWVHNPDVINTFQMHIHENHILSYKSEYDFQRFNLWVLWSFAKQYLAHIEQKSMAMRVCFGGFLKLQPLDVIN